MKARLLALSLAAAALLAARPTSARDDRLTLKIKDALEHSDAKQKLDVGIRLYFGKRAHPKALQDLGDYKANEKTRAMGRSDQEACDWAFLSAVLKLQERARNLQANAVVDIVSLHKNETIASETDYVCGAGSMMSGVALQGHFVKLPK